MTPAVDLDPPRPAPGLLEVPLAHGAAGGRARPLTFTTLPVRADGGCERGERDVERDRHGGAVERGVRGRRQPPLLHRRQSLIHDAADLQAGVDHLPLLADRVHGREAAAGHPHRQAHVDRALVGPHPDPGEEAGVGRGVVAVEVVGLAPCPVGLDGVGEVVSLVEDGHDATLGGSRASGRVVDQRARRGAAARWSTRRRRVAPVPLRARGGCAAASAPARARRCR